MGVLYELIQKKEKMILEEANKKVQTANEAHLKRVSELQKMHVNGEISFSHFCRESTASFESTEKNNHQVNAKAREAIDRINKAVQVIVSVLTI